MKALAKAVTLTDGSMVYNVVVTAPYNSGQIVFELPCKDDVSAFCLVAAIERYTL